MTIRVKMDKETINVSSITRVITRIRRFTVDEYGYPWSYTPGTSIRARQPSTFHWDGSDWIVDSWFDPMSYFVTGDSRTTEIELTTEAVIVKYIELKDSINSLPPAAEKAQWLHEWRLAKPPILQKRPRVPRQILLKPLRLKRIKKLKLIKPLEVKMRSPYKGKKWKPKKFAQLLEQRNAFIFKENKKRTARFLLLSKWNENLTRLYKMKKAQIRAVNEKRQQKYLLRLAHWNRAVMNAEKGYIATRKRSRKYKQDNPYRRLRLSKIGDVNYALVTATDTRWLANYGYTPIFKLDRRTTIEWEVSVRDHIPSYLLTTGEQQTAVAEDMFASIKRSALTLSDDIDKKSRAKIYSKFSNQKVHLANVIAERHQALTLFKTALQRIVSLVSLKKSVLKNALMLIRNPKLIASEFLAFKFGVEPLVSDIQTALKFLSTETDKAVVDVRTRTTKKGTFAADDFTFIGEISVSYVIKTSMDNVMFQKLNEWGLVNPLEVAWEMTPWSFVVDWLYPFGRLISSLSATTGLTFLTGTKHVKMNGTFEWRSPYDPLDDSSPGLKFTYSRNVSTLPGTWVGVFEFRDVLLDFPDYPITAIKNPFSITHSLEALALLIQRIK